MTTRGLYTALHSNGQVRKVPGSAINLVRRRNQMFRTPLGTAFFQIAAHWSGVRTAEGRPADIVFCWAAA
jgi:hypothetical protein